MPTVDLAPAFLADIVAAPADDVPRLIYSDWLEDIGRESQAKFIRLQIEANLLAAKSDDEVGHIANMTPRVCECPRCLLPRKTGAMLNQGQPNYGWLWAGKPLNLPKLFDRVRLTYHRGFVVGVEIALEDWLHYGRAIVLSQPVTVVELKSKMPKVLNRGPDYYVWKAGGDTGETLPYDALPAEWFPDDYSGEATFADYYEATQWASGKAVAWARAQAKLPPLEVTP